MTHTSCEGLCPNSMCYRAGRLDYVRETRWQFGSVLPVEVKQNLSEPEVRPFHVNSHSVSSGVTLFVYKPLKMVTLVASYNFRLISLA